MSKPEQFMTAGANLSLWRVATQYEPLQQNVFRAAARLACQLVGASKAVVTLIEGNQRLFLSGHGFDLSLLGDCEGGLGNGFCRQVFLKQCPLVIGDTANEATPDQRASLAGLDVAAYLGVPIRSASRGVLGSLCVLDSHPRSWRSEEISCLVDLAGTVGETVALWEVNYANRMTEQRLAIQTATSKLLLEARDVGSAIAQLLPILGEALEMDVAEFFQLNRESSHLQLARSWHRYPTLSEFSALLEGVPIRLSEGLPGFIWSSGNGQAISDFSRVNGLIRGTALRELGIRSAVGFSIPSTSGPAGVVLLFRQQLLSDDPVLLPTLETLGRQLALFAERQFLDEQRSTLSQRLQAIIDASQQVALIATDAHGRISLFNTGAERILGYSRNEVLGIASPATFHTEDDVAAITKNYLPEGSQASWDSLRNYINQYRFVEWNSKWKCKNGERRDVSLAISPIQDEAGNSNGFLTIARDLTDSLKLEADHLESKRAQVQLSALVHTSYDLIVLTDLHGNVTYINAAGRRMLGLPSTGPVPSRSHDYIHPEDLGSTAVEMTQALSAYGSWSGKQRLRNFSTGDWIEAEGHHVLVCDPVTHLPMCFGSIQRDMTERLRIEDELRRAKEAAESANVAKSMFLAMMSHEVRTPMAAIIGFGDMLIDPLLGPEKREKAVAGIRSSGNYLMHIINDILDLSKIEAGKMELNPIPFSPWRVVLDVLSSMEPHAQQKQVHLIPTVVGSIPEKLQFDPVRVSQVLYNLVSNAVKFSNPGGKVTIRMTVDQPRSDAPNETWMHLDVEDQGIGIDRAQLDRLFIPFQQVDSSMTRKYGGTGLGLSITRRLVEAMHGKIAVHSIPGEGSRFSVQMQLAVPTPRPAWFAGDQFQLAAATRGSASNTGEQPTFNGRVLLAEDNQDNRQIISYYLQRMQLSVEFAHNGQEALEKAAASRYDLILMDMQMPVLDGYAAAKALRGSGYARPIVALTAHAMPSDREKCLQAGCSEYISKPVDLRELVQIFAKYLSRRNVVASPTDLTNRKISQVDCDNMCDQSGTHQPPIQQPPAQAREMDPAPASFDDTPLPPDADAFDDMGPLVTQYVQGLSKKVADLQAALAAGDVPKIIVMAHQTKGVGTTYGYPSLTQQAAILESAARATPSPTELRPLVDQFAHLVSRIIRGFPGNQS